MKKIIDQGKIVFVGAGCGDPELITVKGMRALQSAEVVLTDRLVSPELIQCYTSSSAHVIYVGKQCRKGNSTSQATINELMVLYARDGKNVVRLKGGDVSIFSNILDELITLVDHAISYEIIPGITAASGAAAYAGIPLTARDHATAVRFLTAYKSDIVSDDYWRELAQTDDTLVFYMSSETLKMVADHLLHHNIAADKQLAIIEQATTPFQQVHTCALSDYKKYINREFISPTLVIIGRVVSLHQKFKWFAASSNQQQYFNTTELLSPQQEQLSLTA